MALLAPLVAACGDAVLSRSPGGAGDGSVAVESAAGRTGTESAAEAGRQSASRATGSASADDAAAGRQKGPSVNDKVNKTDEQWRRELPPQQYYVTRQKGTEPAFTGKYWNNHEKGIYRCADCGLELFSSETKFDSGTGWPSFFAPIAPDRVAVEEDASLGMIREEVHCPRCGAHLGHLFDDGPRPTGQRYCMNSVSLDFVKDE